MQNSKGFFSRGEGLGFFGMALLWPAGLFCAAIFLFTIMPLTHKVLAENIEEESSICLNAVKAVERIRRTPEHLLGAIAMAESGRGLKGHPWPWTIMAEGKGQYFPTKKAAISRVRALQKRGVKNIDVGCMQINLHYHSKQFDSLEEVFDPIHNVAYALAFLGNLHDRHKNWIQAIRHYHSSLPERQNIYQRKVVRIWQRLKSFSHQALIRKKNKENVGKKLVQVPVVNRKGKWGFNSYKQQKQMEARARALSFSPRQ